jgi:hypothetical protein
MLITRLFSTTTKAQRTIGRTQVKRMESPEHYIGVGTHITCPASRFEPSMLCYVALTLSSTLYATNNIQEIDLLYSKLVLDDMAEVSKCSDLLPLPDNGRPQVFRIPGGNNGTQLYTKAMFDAGESATNLYVSNRLAAADACSAYISNGWFIDTSELDFDNAIDILPFPIYGALLEWPLELTIQCHVLERSGLVFITTSDHQGEVPSFSSIDAFTVPVTHGSFFTQCKFGVSTPHPPSLPPAPPSLPSNEFRLCDNFVLVPTNISSNYENCRADKGSPLCLQDGGKCLSSDPHAGDENTLELYLLNYPFCIDTLVQNSENPLTLDEHLCIVNASHIDGITTDPALCLSEMPSSINRCGVPDYEFYFYTALVTNPPPPNPSPPPFRGKPFTLAQSRMPRRPPPPSWPMAVPSMPPMPQPTNESKLLVLVLTVIASLLLLLLLLVLILCFTTFKGHRLNPFIANNRAIAATASYEPARFNSLQLPSFVM